MADISGRMKQIYRKKAMVGGRSCRCVKNCKCVRGGSVAENKIIRDLMNMGRQSGGIVVSKRYRGSGSKSTKRRGKNQWIIFVKQFAKVNGLTYPEALSMAGPYYRAEM